MSFSFVSQMHFVCLFTDRWLLVGFSAIWRGSRPRCVCRAGKCRLFARKDHAIGVCKIRGLPAPRRKQGWVNFLFYYSYFSSFTVVDINVGTFMSCTGNVLIRQFLCWKCVCVFFSQTHSLVSLVLVLRLHPHPPLVLLISARIHRTAASNILASSPPNDGPNWPRYGPCSCSFFLLFLSQMCILPNFCSCQTITHSSPCLSISWFFLDGRTPRYAKNSRCPTEP